LQRFGSARRAAEALPELAARGGRGDYATCPREAAEAELFQGVRIGARLVLLGDAAYPRRLLAIDSPPPALWLRGDIEVLTGPTVSIVGARNASALGLRLARRMARELGEAGQIVVSGLARGIDAAAHSAAAETGTVAVLPGGIDCLYPPENAKLAEEIVASGGLLLSETPLGLQPTSRHFPRRNRLISGLADAVVLIEAATRSGSLITARAALDQGREVMACPGAPDDPRAGGCNSLIRDGAALVRSAADVLEALAPLRSHGLAEEGAHFSPAPPAPMVPALGPETAARDADFAEHVLSLIASAPVEVDELARAAGAEPSRLSLALLELDLAGRITLLPGGLVARSTEEEEAFP
ncbi:MAG: DNA-processing protein DprA, partial [Pseudomonadota bacterium]